MNRRQSLAGLYALGAAAAVPCVALAAPPSADDIVKAERAAAEAEHKTLLLFFFASWCPYCRLFELFFADPAVQPILSRYVRILHVRVRERTDEMKAQQWAGAAEMFARYALEQKGVPFLALLDRDGTARVTSIPEHGENIGFPVTEPELDWFESMWIKGAPAMPAADIAALRAACVRLYNS